jgi:hypothetical protein
MLLISFIKLDSVDVDVEDDSCSHASFGVLLNDGFVCDLSSACKFELKANMILHKKIISFDLTNSADNMATNQCIVFFTTRQ